MYDCSRMALMLQFFSVVQLPLSSCPGCTITDTVANCEMANFSTIPPCLGNETELLYLWRNDITALLSNSLSALPNLQYLELSSNPVSILAPDTFVWTPLLTDLWLNSCNLSQLPDGLFSYLPYIRAIVLRENNIQELPENIFNNCSNLRILDISENKFTSLPQNIFNPVPNLNELYVTNNQILFLQDNLFANNANIAMLQVDNNRLSHLNNSTLQPMINLRILTVNNNNLQNISFQLEHLLSLLDISGNNITTVETDLFRGILGLEIYLDYNPWHCDCRINKLLEIFSAQNIRIMDDPKCETPPELKQTSWSSLGQLPCDA